MTRHRGALIAKAAASDMTDFVRRVWLILKCALAFCCLGPINQIAAQPAPGAAIWVHSNSLPQDGPPNTSLATSAANSVYPLKPSTNNRFLLDQNDKPFLMIGDSPQTLIGKLSLAEVEAYVVNRQEYGFNTLWISVLCNYADICRKDARTYDGLAPFTDMGDLSTPNPAYFQRVDDVIKIAAAYGMLVLLDPIETSSWMNLLRVNGEAKAFAYGQYLGRRYKGYPNIIWMHGNDFQSWRNAADDDLVLGVARGIKSEDPTRLHTVELDYLTSGSLDDPSWAPLINLDAAYTYFPTYAQVLIEYNRPKPIPVFLVEANYEFEHVVDGGTAQNLRRQNYWTMLSGATGLLYGNFYSWRFEKGWERNLDTPGAIQLRYMKDLLSSREWYDLVPDQTHAVVTAGYGAFSNFVGNIVAKAGSFGSIPTNNYAAAARTPDGSLVMAYLPTVRTITVDMSKLSGQSAAHWFDPTNGTYVNVSHSPLANSGEKDFTPPGKNAAGDDDWVLVLETANAR